ncbi:NAD(P)-dependent oxidoreductase [Streptomyces sp. S.PB5]|uniref:NAD(P)-dependent oxidoreductase n=1 Tax=Streptomyces sp. S.PB5 TaxID=3020844 RepID=UPI0025AF199B|nr:NAD(P)-dependent oxidoreductase [Streptomyces sp. S.PB5]MDN3028240.1 NAD(P)-dependent oxidoreductase [Streptomyces sp. S.PB5]
MPLNSRVVAKSARSPHVVLLAGEFTAETVRELGFGVTVLRCDGTDRDALLAALAEADAVLVGDAPVIDAEAIAAAPELKIIARAGAALGNVDVAAATERGIQVTDAPEAEALSVAELTVGMLLAVARNIPQAHAALTAGAWQRSLYSGVELSGKVLGIVGLGRVGGLVAERLRAFGMDVVAYDPYAAPERAAALGVRLAPFDQVLAAADFLSVHVPGTGETAGLLDFDALNRVRPEVRLVSVSGTGAFDTNELYAALKEGRVAAAALDLSAAREPADAALAGLDNVVVTPGLAVRSDEAGQRAGAVAAEAVRLALAGEYGPNVVNTHGHAIGDTVRPWLALTERLGEVLTAAAGSIPQHLEVRLLGDLAAEQAGILELAALKGVLSGPSRHPTSLVNAPLRARERGMTVRLVTETEAGSHRSAVALRGIRADGGSVRLAGTLSGLRRHPRLIEAFGHELELPVDGNLAFVSYPDRPGAVGAIGEELADADVNIESLWVARDADTGTALAALVTDVPVAKDVLASAAARVEASHSCTVRAGGKPQPSGPSGRYR